MSERWSRSRKPLEIQRFWGVSLNGGKSEKTAAVLMESLPGRSKVFLTHIEEGISSTDSKTSDFYLLKLIRARENIERIVFNVPLSLPRCLKCRLKCPGAEKCEEPHIKWMWKHHRKIKVKNRKTKIFTPYTQRCSDIHLAHNLEDRFEIQDALGANVAPLTARLLFLKRQIEWPISETNTRVAFLRLGESLGVPKQFLKSPKKVFGGDRCRFEFMKRLLEKDMAFIYEQDVDKIVLNPSVFEAFLCAFMGYLNSINEIEVRPKEFPKTETWPILPLEKFKWIASQK